MYTNLSYLGNPHEDIVDTGVPLKVTAVGYYKVHKSIVINTRRPEGRGDYQLIYIATGKLHLLTGDTEQIIPKGNMILFRPGEEQSYDLYSAEEPETYWVHFTGKNIEEILCHYGMTPGNKVVFSGTSTNYEWLFRQMIKELQLKRNGFDEILNMNLRQVLLLTSRYISEGGGLGSEVLSEVERAVYYFNENYHTNISIEDYAEKRHMSACWFIRSFKQVIKMTPMQYILSLRITNAVSLMDTTSYNMSQIASAVGYDNALYFSRVFKKHTGFTPKHYREQMG